MVTRLATIAPEVENALLALPASSAREVALAAAQLALSDVDLDAEVARVAAAILRGETASRFASEALAASMAQLDGDYLDSLDGGNASSTSPETLRKFRRARAVAAVVGVMSGDTPDEIIYEVSQAVNDREAFWRTLKQCMQQRAGR